MGKLFFVFGAFVSLNCHGQNDWLESSVNWFKGTLPHSLHVDYDKSKIRVADGSQKSHSLLIHKVFPQPFSVETIISVNQDKLGAGPEGQKMEHYHLEVTPWYHISDDMLLGMGVHYGSSPQLTSAVGGKYKLGAETSFMLSGRVKGLKKDHWLEVSVEKYRRQSSTLDLQQDKATRGFSENKLRLKYQGVF
jgi:hypothetical protein